MNRLFFNDGSPNDRGDNNSPPKKHGCFKIYKNNTINSLNDVECFLNNFHHYFKCLKLYKILKK